MIQTGIVYCYGVQVVKEVCMKILVTSLTDHRIDVQLAEWMLAGLSMNNISCTSDIMDIHCTHCIMFNGLSTKDSIARLQRIGSRMPIYYMYDDCDMPVPHGVTAVVSQFTNTGDFYFPIAELAVLHTLWDKPLKNNKIFELFYGGTFKSVRDYSMIPNDAHTLLVGNDTGWDTWTKATRLCTLKDMKAVYYAMSMCKATMIVSDHRHDNVNMPLRAFEGVFADCPVIWRDGTYIYPEAMKLLYTKERTLRLIKELVWNIIQ